MQAYTRHQPFGDIQDSKIVAMVLNGEQPPRPRSDDVIRRGFDDIMWDFMESCCAMNAEERPAASEVVDHLNSVLQSRKDVTAFKTTLASTIGLRQDQVEVSGSKLLILPTPYVHISSS